ncbi:DUF6283 family protein [Mycobacteroides salmoniphilum]|uniref:DUF6283 family protein n=1 Tax=Mycobacteroides salmoniphilum TaxID=404941 RepID=UPI003568699E
MGRVGGPAPRPCASCPYREDVPSGVWHATEYQKLIAYDAPTSEQPTSLFLCHQTDAADQAARLCAGWVGCHGGEELLAIRMGAVTGSLSPEDVQAAFDYVSPVPLFESGRDAAEHGIFEIEDPGGQAITAIEKISRRRVDIGGR